MQPNGFEGFFNITLPGRNHRKNPPLLWVVFRVLRLFGIMMPGSISEAGRKRTPLQKCHPSWVTVVFYKEGPLPLGFWDWYTKKPLWRGGGVAAIYVSPCLWYHQLNLCASQWHNICAMGQTHIHTLEHTRTHHDIHAHANAHNVQVSVLSFIDPRKRKIRNETSVILAYMYNGGPGSDFWKNTPLPRNLRTFWLGVEEWGVEETWPFHELNPYMWGIVITSWTLFRMTMYRNVLIGAACVAAVDAFAPTFGFTGMLMIYDLKICAEQEW